MYINKFIYIYPPTTHTHPSTRSPRTRVGGHRGGVAAADSRKDPAARPHLRAGRGLDPLQWRSWTSPRQKGMSGFKETSSMNNSS